MTGLFAVVLGWLLLALGVGFVVGGIAAVRRFREIARGGAAPDRPVPVG